MYDSKSSMYLVGSRITITNKTPKASKIRLNGQAKFFNLCNTRKTKKKMALEWNKLAIPTKETNKNFFSCNISCNKA